MMIPVEVDITPDDIKYFRFPPNAIFCSIDDSPIMRKSYRFFFERILNLNESQYIIKGNGEEEIVTFLSWFQNFIETNQDKCILLLCDENLDYLNDYPNYGYESDSIDDYDSDDIDYISDNENDYDYNSDNIDDDFNTE